MSASKIFIYLAETIFIAGSVDEFLVYFLTLPWCLLSPRGVSACLSMRLLRSIFTENHTVTLKMTTGLGDVQNYFFLTFDWRLKVAVEYKCTRVLSFQMWICWFVSTRDPPAAPERWRRATSLPSKEKPSTISTPTATSWSTFCPDTRMPSRVSAAMKEPAVGLVRGPRWAEKMSSLQFPVLSFS